MTILARNIVLSSILMLSFTASGQDLSNIDSASETLDAKNITLDFASDEALSILRLTMKQRKNLYLFFKEVINNAAKHSHAKKVSACIYKKEHHVEMVIKDNGKGFDTSQTFNGNGMSSLKKRAEELSGYFTIHSHPNERTVVELKFKIT
jgi:signal transduction histidine kinase